MFERPKTGDKAVLVHIDLPNLTDQDREEFEVIVSAAGAEVLGTLTGGQRVPDAKYFIGKGKVYELNHWVQMYRASLVIFNHGLTSAQERNLERLLQCRVLDRTGLILDIFAQRARTFEGKLQVELAQLKHLSTRLVRGWTHLERQKGGIGLRGPGETQLETDRRLLRGRIKNITERLSRVRQQRGLRRLSRHKGLMPTVSLVGYTNAGKSTLFNYLTESDVYVANQLFATLDPTLRHIDLPQAGPAMLVDTVGFIRHLPHQLVEAFQATLEETEQADLLIHVIDASSREIHGQKEQVEEVLTKIGADQIPTIEVWNKIDLVEGTGSKVETGTETGIESYKGEHHRRYRVWLSAQTGEGVEELLSTIAVCLYGDPVIRRIVLAPKDATIRSQLYDLGAIKSENIDEQGNYHLVIHMPRKRYEQWRERFERVEPLPNGGL